MSDQLNDTVSSFNALQREVEALRMELQHKDELLCFSDRISSRLFDLIHAIRAQVEAAESLSPAICSLSTLTSPSSTPSDTAVFTSSPETSVFSTSDDTPAVTSEVPLSPGQIVKQIQDKYSDFTSA